MEPAVAPSALDALLNRVSDCFTPDTARQLVKLTPDPLVLKRMGELGVKASEGTLTSVERDEYDALIEVGDVVATLQLKARRQLAAVA